MSMAELMQVALHAMLALAFKAVDYSQGTSHPETMRDVPHGMLHRFRQTTFHLRRRQHRCMHTAATSAPKLFVHSNLVMTHASPQG